MYIYICMYVYLYIVYSLIHYRVQTVGLFGQGDIIASAEGEPIVGSGGQEPGSRGKAAGHWAGSQGGEAL